LNSEIGAVITRAEDRLAHVKKRLDFKSCQGLQ